MTRSRSTPASTPADGGARAATPARTVALVPATLALVVVLGAVGAPGTAAAQSDRPTVEVVGGTVAGGDATTVRVVLTAAPDGLAGYYLRLSVADPEVARFANASYPDRFGMTTEPELGDDGRTVALEAADLDGSVEPGATDVTLATVAVSGVAPGEARVTVDPIQLDADGGSAIDATTRAAEITVTPDGGSDADESAAGTDGDDASDDAAGGADAGNGDAAGADAGDPDGDRAGSGAAGPGVASVLLVAGAGTLLAVGLLIGRRL